MLKATAEAYHANAVVFSFFRDGCCFPVLLIAAALIEKGCRFPRSGRELAVFCGLGVTGMWGNQLFYILGLYYTSATIASCWQPAIPVFAAFIAIVLGVEPFPPLSKLRGWLKLFGILFAAGGAIVLTLGKPAGDASEMKKASLGNIFLLLNCSCMGLYVNIQKVFIFNDKQGSVGERWKPYPVHVTAWSYFFGAIAMILSAVVGFYGEFTFFGFGDCNGVGDSSPTPEGCPTSECRDGRLGAADCCRHSDSTVSANRQLPRAEADARRAGLRRAHLLGAHSPPPGALADFFLSILNPRKRLSTTLISRLCGARGRRCATA